MKGINKAMALIAAAVMALGTAPVIVANAEVAPIVIQAEELAAFGHYVGGVMTKVDRDEGTQQFNGEYLQQATNSADAFNWIYDNTTAPSHGETGEGMQVASWGNKFYALRLRNTASTGNVINEAYYTFSAPYEGEYTLDVYGYTLWSPTLSIYVNGSASPVAVGNLNYYNDGSTGNDIVKQENKATLTLNKGVNTIKMTLNSQTAVLDKFELNFTGEVPQEDNTTIKHVELTVQAEELVAFGHYVDGVMTKVDRDEGTQQFNGEYLQQATNSADAFNWIYDNTTAPSHGETGEGMQVASWGNKFYALRLRNTASTGNVINEAYYTFSAPYEGEYTLDVYGYTLWNPTLSIYVNGSASPVAVGNLNYYNDGSTGNDIVKQENKATLTLNKGVNTIKMTLNSQTAVLDKFVLSADIEVETEAVAPYDTDADTAVSAKDTKDNGDGTFNTAYAARDVSISDFNSIKFYFTKLDAENTPVERIRFKYPLAELSIEGNGAVSFDVTVTNIPEKYNQTEMWLSSDAAAE